MDNGQIEISACGTQYFMPVRYRIVVWSDGRGLGGPLSASSGNSDRRSAQGTILEGVPEVLGSWTRGGRYWRKESRVLDRISI